MAVPLASRPGHQLDHRNCVLLHAGACMGKWPEKNQVAWRGDWLAKGGVAGDRGPGWGGGR
eukprot:55373-Eustigmatos_ZCMA.PRE.1